MADQPTADLNSQLIGRGLDTSAPQNTYVDFANNIVKNQQNQASQEQAIARATELAKQAKLQTNEQQQAADAGYNSLLKDVNTPEAAVLYVKAALAAKGIKTADAEVQAWGDQLKKDGSLVPREVIEAFANRFARAGTHDGLTSPFTTDTLIPVPKGKSAADMGLENMSDADGKSVDDKTVSDGTFRAHVPVDGMYQVIRDSESGQPVAYNFGGKAAVDPQAKADAKANAESEKAWQKLDAAENTFIKSARGNSVTQSIGRAARALNELATNEVLTPQVLSFIQKDISGIFQGGVPPVTGMEAEDFTTTMQKINGVIAKYTGINGYLHTDLGNQREYLLGLISRLYESTMGIFKAMITSEASAYEPIIHANPSRWKEMVDSKTATATAGLSATAQDAVDQRKMSTTPTNIPGVASHAAAPQMDALAGILKLKKKAPKGQ